MADTQKTKPKPLYNKYKVRIKFRERVYGGLPKDPAIMEKYVEAKFKPTDNFAGKLSDEVKPKSEEEKEQEMQEEQESVTTTFKRDAQGCYLGDYVLKAHIKQAASLLKITQKKRGSKDTVKEGLFVKPEHVSLGGEPVGAETFVGHVMTPTGKRSIIKASEYFEKTEIEFELWILNVRMGGEKGLGDDDLKLIFEFGQELGIGSNRSFEKGKYDFLSLVSIDEDGKEISLHKAA